MFDWQTIIVALVVAAALIYTGRLAWRRLRSLRAAKGAASCETGCGSCGGAPKPAATKRTVYVEIGRSRASAQRKPR
jgi:hypothetical protein